MEINCCVWLDVRKQQIYPVISIKLMSNSQLNLKNEWSYIFCFSAVICPGIHRRYLNVFLFISSGRDQAYPKHWKQRVIYISKMNMDINLIFGMWWGILKYIYMIHSTHVVFFPIWVFFNEHSWLTDQQANGEAISLIPLYHFHLLHRHFDISRVITAESSPLHIARSQTWTGNLWFPNASR